MTVDGAAGAGPTNAAAGASASATTRACACLKLSRRWRAVVACSDRVDGVRPRRR